MTDRADTTAKAKRETQRDRVARALLLYCCDPEAAARAAIKAYPAPRILKVKDAPKGPRDSCALYGLRCEVEELCHFIEAHAKPNDATWLGALALVRALREQGVVPMKSEDGPR